MRTEEYCAPSILVDMVPVEAGNIISGVSDNEYGAGAGNLEYDIW